MKNNAEIMKIGTVYRGKITKIADIEKEKVIAVKFHIPDGDVVHYFSYSKYPRQTILNWFRGKYQTDFEHKDELLGTHWYIWRKPETSFYITPIGQSDEDSGEIDELGFPVRQDDEIPF